MNVFSADIERAARFYGGVLGLRKTCRFPVSGDPQHIEYEVGPTSS